MIYTNLPCMKRVIRDTVPQGVRNEMARQFAYACIKGNIPKQRALIIAEDFYYHCDRNDDFSYDEVKQCFNWAYEHEKKDVFVNCNIIIKTGWCDDPDKKDCELYNRQKTEFLKRKKKEKRGRKRRKKDEVDEWIEEKIGG